MASKEDYLFRVLCYTCTLAGDGCVGEMTLSSEQVRDPTVRFRHEIVQVHQVVRISVEQRMLSVSLLRSSSLALFL